jgi:competence ComEA-like helix-hairpin-helix protein
VIKEKIIFKYIILIFSLVSVLYAQIDINNATQKELMELTGIGKAKAKKIITYREENQCFESIDELLQIDGISKKLLQKNRSDLLLGECTNTKNIQKNQSTFLDILFDPVNAVFVILIFILAILDQWLKKDLKSQIISVGVLGTFVGIFIGLQGFDPSDIINSVNYILVGLKTAFFTSIVGMSVATILSIIEKLRMKPE